MHRGVLANRFMIASLCLVLAGGVARARAESCGGAITLNMDNSYVTQCIGPVTGPNVKVGTELLAGVGAPGIHCNGCSATVTCYSALDSSFQYEESEIFSIYTTQNLEPQTFYWTPPAPATYYVACTVWYHNNPGAPGCGPDGQGFTCNVTQTMTITATAD